MRAVLQRVSSASVVVNGGDPRTIGPGLMILLGVKDGDDPAIIPKLAAKCAGLRIFADDEGKLNRSAVELGYSVLVVSNFTLYGDTSRGKRPSFIHAAKGETAKSAYDAFLQELMNAQGLKDVQHGEFGADMQVSLVNDGPVTIIIDTDPAAEAENYLAQLKENNATLTDIFLTHGHYDHVGSVAALKKATGAKVHMDLADAKGDQMYPLTPDLIDAPWPAGNSEYQVDELTFRIWHTPGHTPGGVVIACGDRLFSGDTLFAGSCGRVDLPGGSPAEMQRSLALVAELPLPDETTVYPGHESFTTLGQERRSNPYLMGEVF